jgi:hypothetical protein
MRVLIIISRSPSQRFLVKLHTDELMREVIKLIENRKNSKAMVTALSKGKFDRVVEEDDLARVEADLILSEDGASWDIMK